MALSPSADRLRIGVMADTAAEVRIKFETELLKSLRILEEAKKREVLYVA